MSVGAFCCTLASHSVSVTRRSPRRFRVGTGTTSRRAPPPNVQIVGAGDRIPQSRSQYQLSKIALYITSMSRRNRSCSSRSDFSATFQGLLGRFRQNNSLPLLTNIDGVKSSSWPRYGHQVTIPHVWGNSPCLGWMHHDRMCRGCRCRCSTLVHHNCKLGLQST